MIFVPGGGMGEPAYILAVLLLAAGLIIVSLFIKLSRLKKQPRFAVREENPPVDKGRAAPDEQEDLKIKLISILAHNCRGALMNIISLTDLYQKGQVTKQQFDELIAEMRTTSRHDLDAFEKILKWVKVQLKSFEFNLLEINVSSLLEQTIYNNISDINRKKISLTVKDNDEDWVICGDTRLLEFVMTNLLNNAVKYSYHDGEVACVIGHPAGSASGMIQLEVTDHGVGMDEKTRERVFCHEKTIYTGTDGEKGAGIALLICQDFVKMQGGTLEVRTAPGKGTVFTLLIPGRAGRATEASCGDRLKADS